VLGDPASQSALQPRLSPGAVESAAHASYGTGRFAHRSSLTTMAIVDAGGHLVAFVRQDGALIGSIDLAIDKACSRST
jgi:uncharacterized protein GlcG (DUF336 family)